MRSAAASKAPALETAGAPPRICCSESFDKSQKAIREAALERVGYFETVIGLEGVTNDRGVFILNPVVPLASVYPSHFKVKSRHWRNAWAEREKKAPALRPVGDGHYHPGGGSHGYEWGWERGSPHPSSTDQKNRVRQAETYLPFNLQTVAHRTELKAAAAGNGEGGLLLRIDPQRSLHLLIQGLPGPEAVTRALFREEERRAWWTSLIYHSDADVGHAHATVIVHSLHAGRGGKIDVKVVEGVPVERIADEDMAELTGLPLEEIRLKIDPEEIGREVQEKYRKADSRGWSSWGDDDDEDRERERAAGGVSGGGYPVVVYGGYAGPRGGLGADASRRSAGDLARMLRRAAERVEKDRLYSAGRWDRNHEILRDETIWDLEVCIGWLRHRLPWGEA